MKQRIDYLDIAKGIGILLMVSAHIYDSDLYQVIVYSFHMPLFILISGFLLGKSKNADKSFGAFFASKFKGLMVPYIITEICVLPLFYFRYGYQPSDLQWIITDSLFLYYTRGSATWFLLSLFLSEILFRLLRKCIKNRKILAVSCVLLYILSACGYSGNHIAVILLRSLHGMFFLAVGYSAARMERTIKLSVIQILFLTVSCGLAALCNGKVAMVDSNYGNIVLYTYTSLVGSFFVLRVSKGLTRNHALGKITDCLKYWGRNSLCVVCTHLIILRYGIDWMFKIGPNYPFFAGTFIFIFVMVCEAALIAATHRIKTLPVPGGADRQ